MRPLVRVMACALAVSCSAPAHATDGTLPTYGFAEAMARAHVVILLSEKLRTHFDAELWSLSNTPQCYMAATDIHFGTILAVQFGQSLMQRLRDTDDRLAPTHVARLEQVLRGAFFARQPIDLAYRSCKK